MRDIYGHECVIRAERGYHGYGSYPFSITRSVRQGVRGYEAEWFPTRNRARFATKREAVAFIKAHEAIAYGTAPEGV